MLERNELSNHEETLRNCERMLQSERSLSEKTPYHMILTI
jgi:hypothetical protein